MTTTAPPYEPTPPPAPAQVPPSGPGYPYPPTRHRPAGVTILAVLEILFGLLMLLAAFGFFVLAGLFTTQELINQLGPNVPQWLINMAPMIFAIVAIVFLIMALIAFLLAYGFIKGRGWAWTLAMIFSVISIIMAVVGWVLQGFNPAGLVSMIISIIIPVIIILYLTRTNVKAWFGKV